ncbi:hypothetical protein [Arthrobacter koreensis]|uniref:hypothetical protein n=2 Tax=Arthrobacter TaxID=1663 RepID=UPI00363DEE5F
MAMKAALKGTGLVLCAVLLGLMTVQGTYALWSASAPSAGGSLQAASFNVEMDGGAGVVMMEQPDGSQGTVGLATAPLGPVNAGESVYAGVKLTNLTDAGGTFTLAATAGQPVVGGSLAPLLDIDQRAVGGADLAACSNPALFTGPAAPALELPKGTSGVLCFRVTLSAAANAEGQTSTISIPLTVEQKG